jgi:hypothetical protein
MIFVSKKRGVLFVYSLLMASFLGYQFLGAMEYEEKNLGSVILKLKQKLEQVKERLNGKRKKEMGEKKGTLELPLNEFLSGQEDLETEALAIECDKNITVDSDDNDNQLTKMLQQALNSIKKHNSKSQHYPPSNQFNQNCQSKTSQDSPLSKFQSFQTKNPFSTSYFPLVPSYQHFNQKQNIFEEMSLSGFLSNQESYKTETLVIQCDKETTVDSFIDFKKAFEKFDNLKNLELNFDNVIPSRMSMIVNGLYRDKSFPNFWYDFNLPKNLNKLTINFNGSNVTKDMFYNLNGLFSKLSTLRLLQTLKINLENINKENIDVIAGGLKIAYGPFCTHKLTTFNIEVEETYASKFDDLGAKINGKESKKAVLGDKFKQLMKDGSLNFSSKFSLLQPKKSPQNQFEQLKTSNNKNPDESPQSKKFQSFQTKNQFPTSHFPTVSPYQQSSQNQNTSEEMSLNEFLITQEDSETKTLTIQCDNTNIIGYIRFNVIFKKFNMFQNLKLSFENIDKKNMYHIVNRLRNDGLPRNLKSLTLNFNESNLKDDEKYLLSDFFSKFPTLTSLQTLKIKLENINEKNIDEIAEGLKIAYMSFGTHKPTTFNIEVEETYASKFDDLGATITIIQK